MARNLEVSIRIEMNETDAPLSANSEEAEAISSGHFRLALDIALMAKSDVLSLRPTMFATPMDELHFMVSMRFFERGSNGIKQQVSNSRFQRECHPTWSSGPQLSQNGYRI